MALLFPHELCPGAVAELPPAGPHSLPPRSPKKLGNPTRDIPQEFLAGRKPTPGSPPLAGSTHRRRLLRVAFPAAMAVGRLPSSDAFLLLLLLFCAAAMKTLTRAGGERGQLSASPAPAELLPAVVPPPLADEEEKVRGSREIGNGRKFSLFSPDQRSAESKEPGWGQEGLAACRARSVPESKHSERGEHLTLLPEFPAVTLKEQN